MGMDASSFLVRFPEFKRVELKTIEAKIAEAVPQLSETIWGVKFDIGLGYLVAHLLSTAPGGQHARLVPPNAKPVRGEALTTYEREYKRLLKTVASGFRVTGKNNTNPCDP